MNYHPPDPLKQAFTRLNDAHRHWCQAETEYFDPNGFRVAINACIQALRSVTFVLQKNKNSIEGFEQWYSGWRAKFKADTVLKWSVQARNRIVKECDLEVHSVLRISIVASYHDLPYQEFSTSPISKTKDILNDLNTREIPVDLLKNGFLKIERRWIADDLPDYELLDGLAHCYSMLSLLLHDAWKFLDPSAPKPPLLSGCLPCMIRSDEDRAIWVRLSNGKIEHIQTLPQVLDLVKQDEVIARYGNINTEPAPVDASKLKKTAFHLFQLARTLLERDKYHEFLVFLFLPNNAIKLFQLYPEDQGDKYRMWREVATYVAKTDAIGVITINEIWFYPLHKATEGPNRNEALYLAAISRDGEEFALIAPFSRQKDRIILQETAEQELGDANFLKPIRAIWAK